MGAFMIAMISERRGLTIDRSSTIYRKVLASDIDIFSLPDSLDTSIAYNSDTLLEDGEWFYLSDFSSKSYCLNFLKQKAFSSVDYDALQSDDFGRIVFLCGYQNNNFHFQRITPARQVNQKRIFFGTQCKYEENSASIALSEYADAIYCPNNDKLFFRKLRDISAIFNGIDEIYREAKEEDVRSFLESDFIELSAGFFSDNVKTNNRKRIAKALEILRAFSDSDKQKIFDYTKDYCPEIANTNNKFSICSEADLKKMLYGIEQRYYTTLIGEERRLANSIISISHGGDQ